MVPVDSKDLLRRWQNCLDQAKVDLRQIAGETENDFLRVGDRLQAIHQETVELDRTAQKLVSHASGGHMRSLIERLHNMAAQMETYLSDSHAAGGRSSELLANMENLLHQVSTPLAGFKRVSKNLYILEVSIKVESAYLGSRGEEFVNLALDIRRLSQQIKENAGNLADQRLLLSTLLRKNLQGFTSTKTSQEEDLAATLENIENGLDGLQGMNESFAQLGGDISSVATNNAAYLSTVVQSMQFHDIFRQQVEHILESLEEVSVSLDLHDASAEMLPEERVIRLGDVCELQESQLRFAKDDIHRAVVTVLSNLQDISSGQDALTDSIIRRTGTQTGSDFLVNEISRQMNNSVTLLGKNAQQNSDLAATMQQVSETVAGMTAYVEEIEEIGNDIIHLSLNARIKSSSTGQEGDALSVLAGEIGQLSNEAVHQTDLITGPLNEIHAATDQLSADVDHLETTLSASLDGLRHEASDIFQDLAGMGQELVMLVDQVDEQVGRLKRNIERLCLETRVHEHIREKSERVIALLATVHQEARKMYPASEEFRRDLHTMAEKYTMESERRIHESLTRKYSGEEYQPVEAETAAAANDSGEFGDNVELF